MSAGESTPVPWICAQIGSREHYAIPRVLHESGRLRMLLTDYWAGADKKPAGSGRAAKVAQRFHPQLANARVEHLGVRRIAFDLVAKLRRRDGWTTILARNAWFQRSMLRRLRREDEAALRARPGIFFSYSYAALDLFRFFRGLGWKTVLGQMDPGTREDEIVAAERARRPDVTSSWSPAPPEYWRLWREECAASDHIVVNSPWSRDALVASGLAPEKIGILPLAYERPPTPPPAKKYPSAFSAERPLRVLFLGQIILRKGAHLALDAARLLRDMPVEWQFVGPSELALPADLAESKRVRWSGPVSRAETVKLYADADVFILPTLSDGFALTQLEAQAVRVPLLASRFCGAVVRDGVNGWLVDPLSADGIADVVRRCLAHPDQLAQMSEASEVGAEFSLAALKGNLVSIEKELFAHR